MPRWPALALALGVAGITAYQAQAAIFWPGGGAGGNDKEADFQEGYDNGQADCRATPLECGVKLGDMIRNQGYGETEPNNHIINADGLLPGQFYHGNSLDAQDEDWYYLITDRKNQKLTVYFLGDSGNYSNTGGWLIQVRDLRGNIIAAFDSAVATGGAGVEGGPASGPDGVSPVDLAKLAEVTLGQIGSYYVSVKPREDTGTLRGYHIGITLKNTGQVTGIENENRFDTETEPNNRPRDADVLRSNVAMVGVFHRTLVKYDWVTTPAKTEYKYFYVGWDQDNAILPSGKNDFACDITKVSPVGNRYVTPGNPNITNPPPADCAANVDSGNPDAACRPETACVAVAFTTPAKKEKRGIFDYDTDVYVYRSEGDEQLRVQICTRTECEFEKVHLLVTSGNGATVLMDGPIEPGQVIDMGAVRPGDYYFTLSAEEEGVDSETGKPQVVDLVGPYDILLMGTRLSPSGGTVPTSSNPPEKPRPPVTDDDTNDDRKESGNSGSGDLPSSWSNNPFGG